MAHMARGYGNATTQWQTSGYHFEDDPRRVTRLSGKIFRAKQIGILLARWLLNMLTAGLIVLSCTGVVYLVVTMIIQISDYIH